MTRWSEEDTARLRHLAQTTNLSAAEMGRRIGRSRNSVIGHCARKNIALPCACGLSRSQPGPWPSRRSRKRRMKSPRGGPDTSDTAFFNPRMRHEAPPCREGRHSRPKASKATPCKGGRHSRPKASEAPPCREGRQSRPEASEAPPCREGRQSRPEASEATPCKGGRHSRPERKGETARHAMRFVDALLQGGRCKFPLGPLGEGAGPDMQVCGAPLPNHRKGLARSFCDHHVDISIGSVRGDAKDD